MQLQMSSKTVMEMSKLKYAYFQESLDFDKHGVCKQDAQNPK